MNTLYRPAAVAGSFYPADASQLKDMVLGFLKDAKAAEDSCLPKALIVPHAGLIYSGIVAASAYKQLVNVKDKIDRVVLLGPSHRVSFNGIACSSVDFFQTPLGDIKLDKQGAERLVQLPQVQFLEQAHTQEHSLEVQLPFLQAVLDDFKLLPLVVGDASESDVAQVIQQVITDHRTLVLISTDLSHFLPYEQALEKDNKTVNAILNYQTQDIAGQNACGCRPVNGLLHYAKQNGLTITKLDVKNSGDTAGSKDRVVGYAAFMLCENSGGLDKKQQTTLLGLARDSIKCGLENSTALPIDLKYFEPLLQKKGACFVTLHKNGQLRGCIGALSAYQSLVEDVAQNAFSAAFKDPRFPVLTKQEFDLISIDISILSSAEVINFSSEEDLKSKIKPKIDGLIIEDKQYRGTFLPSVWVQLPTVDLFLAHLKQKAGLPQDYWSDSIKVSRYQTQIFGE